MPTQAADANVIVISLAVLFRLDVAASYTSSSANPSSSPNSDDVEALQYPFLGPTLLPPPTTG